MNDLKEYQIIIEETLTRSIIKKAKSIDEALEMVEEDYFNEKIILDREDYVDTVFYKNYQFNKK